MGARDAFPIPLRFLIIWILEAIIIIMGYNVVLITRNFEFLREVTPLFCHIIISVSLYETTCGRHR